MVFMRILLAHSQHPLTGKSIPQEEAIEEDSPADLLHQPVSHFNEWLDARPSISCGAAQEAREHEEWRI